MKIYKWELYKEGDESPYHTGSVRANSVLSAYPLAVTLADKSTADIYDVEYVSSRKVTIALDTPKGDEEYMVVEVR